MYVGMNNYNLYIPEICDGGFCCRDCDRCPKADEILEMRVIKAELKICGGGFVKCSKCKTILTNYDNDKWNYCPNCGVKFEIVKADEILERMEEEE